MPNSFATPWILVHLVSLSLGFSRYEYWSGLPLPSSGDHSNPGVEPMSSASPASAGGFFTTEPPRKPIFGYTDPKNLLEK